jgi:Mn2+/Fe2+ NRAMP family transporter
VAAPRSRRFLGVFGPGFVAGASNNDPTTVAALAVVGATTGYDLAWIVVLIVPMLAIVQVIAASVGSVTGSGLQSALRRRYGPAATLPSLCAVAAVSVLTLAADIEAGAEALHLITGAARAAFILPFGLLAGLLLFTSRFARIERMLAFATLGFATYAVSAVMAHPDWGSLAHALFAPRLPFDAVHISGAIALLGTTLTSYVYYWESIEVSRSGTVPSGVCVARRDAVTGLAFSGLSFFFILLGTAATLGVNHHSLVTAADAALALEPLAGKDAKLVFACGLFASAAIAVPVIAATIGFVTGETFGMKADLDANPADARGFYATLAASLAIGAALAWPNRPPIALLFAASIVGGLATPLTLALLVAVARDRSIMGEQRIGVPLAAAGVAVTAAVTGCAAAYLVTSWGDLVSFVR